MRVRPIVGEPTRFYVDSDSRDDVTHIVSFHRTSDPDYIEERCTCEDFTMGIPRQIAEGKIRNTIGNRRCKHIRKVRDVLLFWFIRNLVSCDASQQGDVLKRKSLVEGVKTTE